MHSWRNALLLVGLLSGCKSGNGMITGDPMADMGTMSMAPIGSRIELATTKRNLESGIISTSFSFVDQSELWVRVITPAMPKSTMLHLTFTNPKGVLIYTDDSAFTTDPAGGQMMNPAMGEPMMMNVVKSIPGGSALDRGLPVAGTTFVKIPEDGVWKVQATLDGVPGVIFTTMTITFTR